jgi:hypothetical protein
VREGQVWYSRYYGYNLDGSRAMVMRDDALNGTHWDVYAYDPVSGRLASVQDALTGEVHSFVWNPEGTLARWEEPNSYARVFGYDEEGQLVKIERDYGCAGGVGGGVAACIALCTKIPSPWCWPICLAVVVLVAIGCAFAYNQIMNQYMEQLRNCYDKWFACIQGCVPRPKGCQIGSQVPMVCPVY